MALTRKKTKQDRLAWIHSELDETDLDPFTFRVYFHLVRRSNDGKAWPMQKSIADACGISLRQVSRCIALLEERALIVVTQNGKASGGRSTTYHLTAASEWLKNAAQRQSDTPDSHVGSEPTRQVGVADMPVGHSAIQEEGNPTKEIHHSIPDPSIKKPATKTRKKKTADEIDAMKALEQLADQTPAEFMKSDEFVQSWKDWAKARKNPLTLVAAQKNMKKLREWPVATAIKSLDRAAMSSWDGVFPESVDRSPQSGKFTGASGNASEQNFGW